MATQQPPLYWLKVPLELRLKIYDLVLAGYMIRSSNPPHRIKDLMWDVKEHETAYYIRTKRFIIPVLDTPCLDAFLRTCTAVEFEDRTYLY